MKAMYALFKASGRPIEEWIGEELPGLARAWVEEHGVPPKTVGAGDEYAGLRKAAGEKASTLAENRAWVHRWLSSPVGEIPAASVPSLEAVNLLMQARSDPKWFLDKIYSKADAKGGGDGSESGGLTDEDKTLDGMLSEFEGYVQAARERGEL